MGWDQERRQEELMAPCRIVSFQKVVRAPLFIDPTADDVARPLSRWEFLETFYENGLAFDVLVNWDGRAKIEQNGKTVLAFWCPAADILRACDHRRQGAQGQAVTVVNLDDRRRKDRLSVRGERAD
jgi:hypothetical protein